MPRHPTARRVHRPPATSDDIFVERVLETTAWAKTHQRLLIGAAVTIVVLAVLGLYYRNYRNVTRENAATELTQIQQTVISGNDALAIRDLEQFLEKYGATAAAPEARLMLARALLQNNQPARAIELIGEQARDLDSPMGPSAAFLLADAHEASNQFEQAETVLLRIAAGAPFPFQKERAFDGVARLRMERGDAAGAVQAYDQLLGILPTNSPDRIVYEMRRAEAHARATSGT
jgi:predicted negative regulator of RcsB-dependent stress response